MMESYDQMKAARIKQSRRDLLEALNAMYGIGPADFPMLCTALLHLELPSDEYVKQDLIYLIDKGYVRWTNEANFQPWTKRLFALTARGKEIVDRIAKDPALEP